MALVQAFAGWGRVRSLSRSTWESRGRHDGFDDVDLTRPVGWLPRTFFPVKCDLSEARTAGRRLEVVRDVLRSVPNGGDPGPAYCVIFAEENRRAGRSPEAARTLARLRRGCAAGSDQLQAARRRSTSCYPGPALFRLARNRAGAARRQRGERIMCSEVNGSVADGRAPDELDSVLREPVPAQHGLRHMARRYVEALRSAIRYRPETDAATAVGRAPSYVPADFPAAKIDRRELEKLVAKLSRNAARPTRLGRPSSAKNAFGGFPALHRSDEEITLPPVDIEDIYGCHPSSKASSSTACLLRSAALYDVVMACTRFGSPGRAGLRAGVAGRVR